MKSRLCKILILLNTALTIGLYFFAVSARQERDKLEGNQGRILTNQDTLKSNSSDSAFERAVRGGHSISRIRTFEQWDVDYYKPDLILQQCCMINENMDVAQPDGTPKDMATNTPAAFSERFRAYSQSLKDKTYTPELIVWSLHFAVGNAYLRRGAGE